MVTATSICYTSAQYTTKTAYADSFTQEQLDFIKKAENYKIDNCVQEQFYLVQRHGSRYPAEKQIVLSKDFLEQLDLFTKKRQIQSKILNELKLTFHDLPRLGLSGHGSQELTGIASRYRQRYPDLFDINNKSEISVISSDLPRTIDSSKYFIKGVYGSSILADQIIEKIALNNTMMRLFELCTKYQIEVSTNKTAAIDIPLFKNGTEMKNVLEGFFKRNKIDDSIVANHDHVDLLVKLFALCNVEIAHHMPKNWCRLFEDKDYVVLSYLNDLGAYWKKSYGFEIDAKMMFPVIQDIIVQMEKFIFDRPEKQKVHLRTGHAENIYPLVAALGLFKDNEDLRYDNFEKNINRKFKSAVFTPFSANVAFILNKCNQTSNKTNQTPYDNYKITFLVNELPLSMINGGKIECSQKDANPKSIEYSMCNFIDFKNQISRFLTNTLNGVCSI